MEKIILTTDQDLIKDGVQKIDDEFLEWFVKNPSCEEVKVIKHLVWEEYKIIIPKEESKQDWYCPKCQSYVSSESVTFEETHQIYNTSVIIQETKQQWDINTCRYWDMEIGCEREKCICENQEPKQKTLEEASKIDATEKYGIGYYPDVEKAFIRGAKWQQERSYSKEEVIQLVEDFKKHLIAVPVNEMLSFGEWFNKFKNKL